METPAADTGPVTRSRKSMLLEYVEKENSCTAPETPKKINKSNENVLKEAEVVVQKLSPDVVSSSLKSSRGRRSISLCSNPDSPSKNLRKKNISPEPTDSSSKSKTPADKLSKTSLDPIGSSINIKKLENSIFTIVDSPKPRKTRSSTNGSIDPSAPAVDTPTLRRSRRLSTELNIVQEDPIREAEVNTPTLLPSSKTRRGKRLSVIPSQPSLPEENENPLVNICKQIEGKSSADLNKSQNGSLTSVSSPVNTCVQNVETDGPEKKTEEIVINSEDLCEEKNGNGENINLKLNSSSNNKDSFCKSLTEKCPTEMSEPNSSSSEIDKNLCVSEEIDPSNNSVKNIFEGKLNETNVSNKEDSKEANNESNIIVTNVSLKEKNDSEKESVNDTVVNNIHNSHNENSFNEMNLSKNNSSRVSAKEIFMEEKMDQTDVSIISKNGMEEENNLTSSEDKTLNTSLPRKKSDVITSTPVVLNNVINEKTTKINNKSNNSVSELSSKFCSVDEKHNDDVISVSANEDSVDFKLTFIDDAASDAGSGYKSGDSMTKSEREYIEENELNEKGESLNSDSSSITSDDSYEKDSFICSSDVEDEQLLDGTGDDLSSADELTQSKESKDKYNDKQKKIQKKASKEMFEARHSGDKEKLVNDIGSSFDKSLESSVENDCSEKEISAVNLTSIGNDPLLNKDDNSNSSADSESLTKIHRQFDEELKKLQVSVIKRSSDTDTETDDEKIMIDEIPSEIFNNEKSNANGSVSEKSNEAKVLKKLKTKKDLTDIVNKSDVVYSNKSKKLKSNNQSLNLSSHSDLNSQKSSKMLSMSESKERLINLNKSLSKIYRTLEKRCEEMPAIDVSLQNRVEEVLAENTEPPKLIKCQKRRMEIVENEVPIKRMKQTESMESDDFEILNDEMECDQVQKVTNNLKKKKYKKLSKQKSDNLVAVEDAGNRSILGFKVKQANQLCSKGSSVSTTEFKVETLKCNDNIVACTESAGTFSVTEKWMKNNIPGSTTQFNVVALRNHPKKIMKVNSKVDKFINFKTDMLYNKNIKRESSIDLLKKQQKSMNLKLFKNIATNY